MSEIEDIEYFYMLLFVILFVEKFNKTLNNNFSLLFKKQY